MKNFLIRLALLGACTILTIADSLAEQCTTNSATGCNSITVVAESLELSSCAATKNAGVIRVRVTNTLNDHSLPITSITLSGPTASAPIPEFDVNAKETKEFTFKGLVNGSYTVITTRNDNGCIYTCSNILVHTRKLNCLPLMCCST